MHKISINKISINKIRIVFIFVLVILNGGYALSLGFQSSIMVVSVLFIICDMLIFRSKFKMINNSSTFLALIILQFILTFVINLDFAGITEYIRLIVLYLFCYYVYVSFESKDIVQGFSDFMYFIAIVSLIFYVWISMYPTLAFTVQNGYGTVYMTCFLSFVNVVSFERNCGIFWEPSVFAAVCFIWGIVEIFVIRKLEQRKMRIVVLVITVFTTYSTSGYIYLLFLFIALIFRNDSGIYSLFRIILAVSLISTGILVYFNYNNILLKLVELNPLAFKKLILNNVSVTDRSVGPLADLYVAATHPFGVGVTNLTSTVKEAASVIFGKTIHTRTSTITYYSAAFGMLCSFTVMIALIKFVKRNIKSFFLTIIMIIGIVFMSISTPLHDSSIFIILLFIGIQENIIKNEVH